MGHFRSFVDGMGFFLQGLRWTARNPRWWLFGLVPALIVFVFYAAGLYFLGANALGIGEWLTPFAEGWGEAIRTTLRAMIGLTVFGAGVVLFAVTFAAVTLILGEPFYEKLSEQVELSCGGLPNSPKVSLWKSVPRSVKDSMVTLGYVLLFTVPLFFLGFVPVIGQSVVPVLGAFVSGFFLTVELTTLAMERRGMTRGNRFAALRGSMAFTLGFGVLVFLVFLIPGAAVVAMPAAVAGGTIMVQTRLVPQAAAGRATGGGRPA